MPLVEESDSEEIDVSDDEFFVDSNSKLSSKDNQPNLPNKRVSRGDIQSEALEEYGDAFVFTGSNSILNLAKAAHSELDFFYCVFPPELLQVIANETNKSMRRFMKDKENRISWNKSDTPLQLRSEISKPREVSVDEIIRFVAVNLAIGHVRKDNIHEYWATDPLSDMPFFSKCIAGERYFLIMQFLSFEGYDKMPNKKDPNYDNLWNIRTFLNILIHRFKYVYYPTEELIVDKVIVNSNGLRPYNPKDREALNLKMYRLVDKNGYFFNLDFHSGREIEFNDLSLKASEHHSIKYLVQCISGNGHKLFLSDVLSFPDIFEDLYHVHKINCKVLKCSKKPKLEFEKCGRKHLRLNDSNNLMKICTSKDGISYEQNNTTVQSNFFFNHKTKTDVEKIFFHLLDLSASNAYVLYKLSKRNISLRDFRIKLIDQLVQSSTVIDVDNERPPNDSNTECLEKERPPNDSNTECLEKELVVSENVETETSELSRVVLEFTGKNSVYGDAEIANSELDFFYCIFPVKLLQLLTDMTNRLIKQAVREDRNNVDRSECDELLPKRRLSPKVCDVTLIEMTRFIALCLTMDHVRKKNINDFWTTEPFLDTPLFGKCIMRERFLSILKFLSFEECNKSSDENNPYQGNLWKISKLIHILNYKFKEVYSPTEELIVDRVIVTDTGLRNYRPKDKDLLNLKMYRLIDKNGYLFNSEFYLGKEHGFSDQSLELSADRSLNHLVQCLSGKGHKLFINEILFSPDLLDDLYRAHKINSNDLIDPKHTWILKKKLKFEIFDRQPLFSDEGDHLTDGGLRYEQNTKDLKNLFFHLLDCSIFNAHVLFKMSKTNVSLKDFRMRLIEQLFESSGVNIRANAKFLSSPTVSECIIDGHWPIERKVRRLCLYCRTNGIERITVVSCKSCDVGLCINCFGPYHESESFYLA